MTQVAAASQAESHEKLQCQHQALRVRLGFQENEILQLKHALDVALTKAGSWGGMKQRISLNKALNVYPEKVWQQATTPNSSFQAQEILQTLENQVHEKDSELRAAQLHIQTLQETEQQLRQSLEQQRQMNSSHQVQQKGSPARPTTDASHLMSQVQFLHIEVERLDKELADVRERSADEIRRLNLAHAAALREKIDEVAALTSENEKLRGQLGPMQRRLGKLHGEDLFERCRLLETQLATAISEKNAALVIKHDYGTRIRKLEDQLKGGRVALAHAERAASEESVVAEEQFKSLNSLVSALSNDRDNLRKELDACKGKLGRPMSVHEAQCDKPKLSDATMQTVSTEPVTESAWCQVNTIQHFASVDTRNAQTVAVALESKCAELDSARADLDRLASVHTETLQFLEITKNRLSDELNRRKTLEGDCEKLSIQVRALQQQHSQQNTLLREKDVSLANAEARMQQAINASAKLEEERRSWEHAMEVHGRDLQQLVASQNLTNLQVQQLTTENDTLREEIQKLLQREAQCNYQIKSKDVELQEVLSAYQSSVKETEKLSTGIKTLERDSDNLRAGLAAKEERIAQMQEQIAQLHAREQQLSIDLQSGDYDRSLLHRKLVQSEAGSAQLQTQLYETQQQLAAAQRVNYEFERNTTELHKQLVIKENENMFLRNRCDDLEHEYGVLQTVSQVEHQRLKELEETNARLVVRGIVSHVAEKEVSATPKRAASSPNMSREVDDLRSALARTTESLHAANASLQRETLKVKDLSAKLETERRYREQFEESQARLQELVRNVAAHE